MHREGSTSRAFRAGRGLAGVLIAVVVVLAAGAPVARGADAPNSLKLTATYNVSATMRWAKKRLFVSSTALVANNTDNSVDALTFNLVPAAIGHLILGGVTAGADAASQVPADATVDDQSIIVTLPSPLDPGQTTSVTISYKSTFGISADNKGYLFEKVNGAATAYRWIPWLSVDHPFATPTYGEPFVTAVSDEVDVTITTDRPVVIASNGVQTAVSEDGLTQTFVAHNVHDFNFSASPNYQTRTGTWGDVSITWYYIRLSPDKLQKWTIAALDRYANRVGPYGWNHLAVAEIGTFLGMESPGMVWISSTHPSLLKYLTAHELAHEWFYAVVGSDQAQEPFADEALAEYLTRDLIGTRASTCADQNLDGSTYDYAADCYYEVIYVQGDNYLDAYRQEMGDAAFWAGIRSYYTDYSFKIGGTKELFDELDTAAGSAAEDHSDRFPSLFPGAGG